MAARSDFMRFRQYDPCEAILCDAVQGEMVRGAESSHHAAPQEVIRWAAKLDTIRGDVARFRHCRI